MNVIERINAKELPDSLIGKHISEIHPTSKITKLLKESFEEKIVAYNISGWLNITRILPVMEDGKRVGTVDLDLFRNNWELSKFLQQIEAMEIEKNIKLPETSKEMESQLSRIHQKNIPLLI